MISFNKINASTKLYLLVFAMSIFIIGIGAYGMRELKTINQNTQTLYADRVFPLEQLTAIRFSYAMGILSIAQQAKTHQITYSEANKQIQNVERIIANKWKTYLKTYLTPEEEKLVKELSVLMNHSTEKIEKLKTILVQEDAAALDHQIKNELYPAIHPVIIQLNKLIVLQVRVSGEIHENSNKSYNTAIKKFLLIIILSLLFAIPFSYYLVRNVRNLIHDLSTSNDQIMASEKKYYSLVEQAGDPIFLLNESAYFIEVNESASKLLGYSRDEFTRMKISDMFAPGEIEKLPLQIDLLIKDKSLLIERRWIKKDGTEIDVEINARMLEGKKYLAIARDITKRKQTEEKLRDSEQKYRKIFENVQDVFFQTSLAGIILEVSPSIKNHTGYTREELTGAHVSVLYYNIADREIILDKLRKNGKIKDHELRFRSSTGEMVYVLLHARLIMDSDGSPSHIDGAFSNITERKNAEIGLAKSEEKHRALIENISDAIILVNKNGETIYQSPSVERIVGYGIKDKRTKVFEYVHPDDLHIALDSFHYSFASPGVTIRNNFRVQHKKGYYIWIEGTITNLLQNPSVKAFIVIYHDITDRKKAELELEATLLELENRVEERTKELSNKNRDILDSINYAKRIQEAKLPKKEEIYSTLPDSFVLFKPKDIVSGDFYFFQKNNNHLIFIAAGDCTGHGVPGAFMSIIGSEKLNDAISQSTDTSEILNLLNKGIKTSLHQSPSIESTRDGMDIALCSIDLKNKIVKYAGANRPFWLIRKGQNELKEISPTKKAIGGLTEDNQYFESHEIQLQSGDTFYLSTDGYADTFGGIHGKKLMSKKFKSLLLDIQNKTMPEQEKFLNDFIENWKAGTEQIDDILVIGVKM